MNEFKFGDRVKTKEKFVDLPRQAIVVSVGKSFYMLAFANGRIEKFSESEILPDDNWISVKKNLPKIETPVLVCLQDGCMFSSWASCEDDDFWFAGEEDDNRVTHWQPLPNAPMS